MISASFDSTNPGQVGGGVPRVTKKNTHPWVQEFFTDSKIFQTESNYLDSFNFYWIFTDLGGAPCGSGEVADGLGGHLGAWGWVWATPTHTRTCTRARTHAHETRARVWHHREFPMVYRHHGEQPFAWNYHVYTHTCACARVRACACARARVCGGCPHPSTPTTHPPSPPQGG